MTNVIVNSEEEDPYDYPFPLTLRQKTPLGLNSPIAGIINGSAEK